jgi:hypothetical protein
MREYRQLDFSVSLYNNLHAKISIIGDSRCKYCMEDFDLLWVATPHTGYLIPF